MTISDELYESVKDLITEELNTAKVLGLVTNLMQFVDTYTGLSGEEKKDIVLQVIDRIIVDLPNDNALKLARPIIPDIINTIINVDKRKIKIKVKKIWKKCCK